MPISLRKIRDAPDLCPFRAGKIRFGAVPGALPRAVEFLRLWRIEWERLCPRRNLRGQSAPSHRRNSTGSFLSMICLKRSSPKGCDSSVPKALPWAVEFLRLWRIEWERLCPRRNLRGQSTPSHRRNSTGGFLSMICLKRSSPKGCDSSAQGNALGTRPPNHH